MFCNHCGSPNADQASYCEKCGLAVSNRAQAVAAGGPGSQSVSYSSAQASPATGYPSPQPQYQAQAPYVDPRIRGGSPSSGSGIYAVGKSPILALFLSFMIPGVGQFYNGDSKRGFPMFLVGVFSLPLLAIPLIGWAAVVGVHIWSMVNAYNVANSKTPIG